MDPRRGNFCLLSYTVAVAVSFFSCGDPNSDPAFTKLLNTDSICIWIQIHNTAFRPFYCENFYTLHNLLINIFLFLLQESTSRVSKYLRFRYRYLLFNNINGDQMLRSRILLGQHKSRHFFVYHLGYRKYGHIGTGFFSPINNTKLIPNFQIF